MKQISFAALAFAASIAGAQTTPAPPVPFQPLAAPGGRFVYGEVNDYRADQYLLDTQTGRLWKSFCIANTEDGKQCAKYGLRPIPIVDDEGKVLSWAPEVPPKK